MMSWNMIRRGGFAALIVLISGLGHLKIASSAPPNGKSKNDVVLKWNEIALDAVAEDHSGTFGTADQKGPTRTSRALAIVHIAIYDAVNAIAGGYEPYITVSTGLPKAKLKKASMEAAVATAAHDTLVVLYPKQASVFDQELVKCLKSVSPKNGLNDGKTVGAKAAANIFANRAADGGNVPDETLLPTVPIVIGLHQPDPINPAQGQHVPLWGSVLPFAIDNVLDFHAPPPPKPDSSDAAERMEYAAALDEVKRLGGDGINTPTERTPEQTEIGLFWAYDGSIGLGTPPRLYNQVVRVIAKSEKNSIAENARLFALVNIAMADAGITCWYSKYQYKFWRPIIGIRAAEDDNNEFTAGDSLWTPLGAPASNGSNGGVNFTPPFPAYTSGHATFGAATFRTLARLYGDAYQFTIGSDELKHTTTDAQGHPRPNVKRHFTSFSQAARENADSRIYLGIHWKFDADAGIVMGNSIADFTIDNYLRPAH